VNKMNKEEIDNALKLLREMDKRETDLSVYLIRHLDSEHAVILRSLSIIEIYVDYLEHDLNELKKEGDEK